MPQEQQHGLQGQGDVQLSRLDGRADVRMMPGAGARSVRMTVRMPAGALSLALMGRFSSTASHDANAQQPSVPAHAATSDANPSSGSPVLANASPSAAARNHVSPYALICIVFPWRLALPFSVYGIGMRVRGGLRCRLAFKV